MLLLSLICNSPVLLSPPPDICSAINLMGWGHGWHEVLPLALDVALLVSFWCLSFSFVCLEEREQQEAIAREKVRLQEMDEEEYDALTEEQKVQFDHELLLALRERKKRSEQAWEYTLSLKERGGHCHCGQ